MITNIQLLRAAAALAVVFYHTGYLLPGGTHTDLQGVAIFFVISGFIIPRVGYKNGRDFLLHRFTRIVPIYWFATIADLSWFSGPHQARIILMLGAAALALVPAEKVVEFLRRRTTRARVAKVLLFALAVFAIDFAYRGFKWMPPATRVLFIRSFAFLPTHDINGDIHPYLGVGWTLNMEIYFYVIFSLAIAINRRVAPLLTAAVLLAERYSYKAGLTTGTFAEFYAHDYIQYFVYGMALHYAFGFVETLPDSILTSRGVRVAVGVAAAVTFFVFVFSQCGVLSFSLPCGPAFVVAAAPLCHSVRLRIAAEPILLIGNASYVLYLFHIFIVETIRGLSQSFHALTISALPGMVSVLIVSALVAVTIRRYIELPLLGQLRRNLVASPAALPLRDAPPENIGVA